MLAFGENSFATGVYFCTGVNILHVPDVESSNALKLYHSLYQDVICHGGDISFDIIQ